MSKAICSKLPLLASQLPAGASRTGFPSWHLTRSVTTLTRSNGGCNDFHTRSPTLTAFFVGYSYNPLCFGMPASQVVVLLCPLLAGCTRDWHGHASAGIAVTV